MPISSREDSLPRWLAPPREAMLITSVTLSVAVLMICGVAPLTAPFVVVASAVLQLYWGWRDHALVERQSMRTAIAFSAPFLVWCVASLLWTPNTTDAGTAIFGLVLFVAASLTALALFEAAADDVLVRLVYAMIGVFVTVALYRAIDESTSAAVTRWFLGRSSLLRSTVDHVTMADGVVVALPSYESNKGIAWLTLLVFPMLLALKAVVRAPMLAVSQGLLAALVGWAVAHSDHETSKLALLGGATAFLIARLSHGLMWRLLVAGWVASVLLVVPVTLGAWKAEVFRRPELQFSGQHRIVIWGITAERAMAMPLMGHGLASTRFDELAPGPKPGMVEGTEFQKSTNLHAHNVFLQAWHELGAIGALLLMIGAWPVLRWLRDRAPTISPYTSATFAIAVIIASLSWSMIAAWFQAMFAFVIMTTAFVAECHRRRHETDAT